MLMYIYISTFDRANGGGRESVREIAVDGCSDGERIVVGTDDAVTAARRAAIIPQVQHGHGTAIGPIFNGHLLLVAARLMIARMLVVVIRPGRVETRLAGRRQSTWFHHSITRIRMLSLFQLILTRASTPIVAR